MRWDPVLVAVFRLQRSMKSLDQRMARLERAIKESSTDSPPPDDSVDLPRPELSRAPSLLDWQPIRNLIQDVPDIGPMGKHLSIPRETGPSLLHIPEPDDDNSRASPVTVPPSPVMCLSEELARAYVASFEDNVQTIYPLIPRAELGAMVERFLETVRPTMGTAESPSALPKSIDNALVLLVLALGQICLSRGRVPETKPAASVVESSSGSNAPAVGDGQNAAPGLDLVAFAVELLDQLTEASLKHTVAWTLAGLFFGQLGRASETSTYIERAASMLHVGPGG
jgi:hypothetical protein